VVGYVSKGSAIKAERKRIQAAAEGKRRFGKTGG
jgi:hypothetical protein